MDLKLSREARSAALAKLAGWQEVSGRDAITQTFVFADFHEAFGFMTRAALVMKDGPPSGGRTSTRPWWTLSTHDAGGLPRAISRWPGDGAHRRRVSTLHLGVGAPPVARQRQANDQHFLRDARHRHRWERSDEADRAGEGAGAARLAELRRHAARLPFAEDLVAAYYCALDRRTPRRVSDFTGRARYFVLPFDFVPDMLPIIGFTDDAAVLATAVRWWPLTSRRNTARGRRLLAQAGRRQGDMNAQAT
jgi:uncharacterized membrane protein YkvA (DUF1232 family)/pterin-4a-carbinolamine dehydratase